MYGISVLYHCISVVLNTDLPFTACRLCCLSVPINISVYACLCLCLSVCLLLSVSVCLSLFLSVYVSVCLSVSPIYTHTYMRFLLSQSISFKLQIPINCRLQDILISPVMKAILASLRHFVMITTKLVTDQRHKKAEMYPHNYMPYLEQTSAIIFLYPISIIHSTHKRCFCRRSCLRPLMTFPT